MSGLWIVLGLFIFVVGWGFIEAFTAPPPDYLEIVKGEQEYGDSE